MCHKQRAKITKLTNKIILTYEYKGSSQILVQSLIFYMNI